MKIIAEVGSNFNTFRDCEVSIEYAARSGAHAVKFQYFSPSDLYGPVAPGDNAKLKADWDNSKLKTEWVPQLAMRAKQCGIEFMCTAFSPEGYRFIDNFVRTHKIASAEMTHPEILDIVNDFGKPTYISTAGADIETEVRPALARLRNVQDVTVMFCVGDYPAKIVDFTAMRELRQALGSKYWCGYSDHSIDVLNIPVMAKFSGARVIEKHVNFVGSRGPDAPHSLNLAEFALFCKNLSDSGYLAKDAALLANHEMRNQWRRRIVATRDIEPGEELVHGVNIGIYRPRRVKGNAMNALDVRKTFKSKAANFIRHGDPIAKDDLIPFSPYGI